MGMAGVLSALHCRQRQVCSGAPSGFLEPLFFDSQTVLYSPHLSRGSWCVPRIFSCESRTILYRASLPAAAAAAQIGEAAVFRTFILDGVFDITQNNRQ